MAGARITGERPVDGVTPDGLVALHTSGYQEVSRRIGTGRVLDIGCGVGFGATQLISHQRTVVGVDYDVPAAVQAGRRWEGRGLQVAAMDGSRLGFPTAAFDAVCSSHIIEHFVDPATHARELARVLRDDGTAVVLTPNAPMDFENPFHVSLFEPASLAALLGRYFDDVSVLGHDGSARAKADFAERRAAAARLLRLDVFDLRHRVPHAWYVAAYSAATRAMYRLQSGRHAHGASGLGPEDFFATDEVGATTLNLLAVARRPRR
jgi:SAM-dependent methyltransferase